MNRTRHLLLPLLALTLIGVSAGCKKKTPIPPAPPPPKAEVQQPRTPNAPVIQLFAAEPGTIKRGQTATLRWQVTDATEVEIDQGIGTVSASGTRGIAPREPITYKLRATSPGGTASATASLLVKPPPFPPPPSAPTLSLGERLAHDVADVFFDFDQHGLREDALGALSQNAVVLKSIFGEFPAGIVILEGHCDERGSAEYNIALGDRRADSAREYLKQLGVPEDRLSIISYGKERPQCSDSDEPCWQKNRRVHFAARER